MSTQTHRERDNVYPAVSSAGKQASAFVLAHTDLVLALPEPGKTYRWHELRESNRDLPFDGRTDYVQKLKSNNVVQAVNVVYERGTNITVWKTNSDLYEYAQAVQSARPGSLPCGHRSGFVTRDAAAGVYECGAEVCNERYDRATIEEVFG